MLFWQNGTSFRPSGEQAKATSTITSLQWSSHRKTPFAGLRYVIVPLPTKSCEGVALLASSVSKCLRSVKSHFVIVESNLKQYLSR